MFINGMRLPQKIYGELMRRYVEEKTVVNSNVEELLKFIFICFIGMAVCINSSCPE